MAIMKKYEDYLRERAIYDEEMENFNNLLSNITDYKKVSKYIQDKIIELRNHLTEINKVKYNKIKTDDNISYTKISRYNADADHVIREFINLLAEAEETEVYDNYFSSIYPDKNDIDFYPEIDIEIKNLNRIHIPIGLPYIIKGCGLGKKIYKQLIYELGYLSTTTLDRTMDSIFVWDSLRKDSKIYTFIKDESVLCISPELDFEKIEELLKEFYNSDYDIKILDNDFRIIHSKDILESDFVSNLLKSNG